MVVSSASFIYLAVFTLRIASVSSLALKKWPYQFGRSQLGTILTKECAYKVQSYWSQPWDPNDPTYDKCTVAVDCVLQHTNETVKQNLASAVVILGLTPSLLSSLGPSISESSMLSFKQPWLSVLVSFGAPAVYPTRIWTYDDPFNAIVRLADQKVRTNDNKALQNLVKMTSKGNIRRFVLSVEYLLAMAAIVNIVQISIDLGQRTVLSWFCGNWYMPVCWVLVPGLIHALGTLSFWLVPKRELPFLPKARSHRSENHGPRKVIVSKGPSSLSMIIYSAAVGFAVGHLMLGTLIFSSLLFMMVSDAIPVIFRFAASAVVARFINQYELTLMREEYGVEWDESFDDAHNVTPEISEYQSSAARI